MPRLVFLEDHKATIAPNLKIAERFGFETHVMPSVDALHAFLKREGSPRALALDVMLPGQSTIFGADGAQPTLGGRRAGLVALDVFARDGLISASTHIAFMTELREVDDLRMAGENALRRAGFKAPRLTVLRKFDQADLEAFRAWLEMASSGPTGVSARDNGQALMRWLKALNWPTVWAAISALAALAALALMR